MPYQITLKYYIMTTTSLISKLEKLNVSYSVEENNGYNKDIKFSINDYTFLAGFIDGKNVIEDFCREICFDQTSQETQRRFFKNFASVLKYANN